MPVYMKQGGLIVYRPSALMTRPLRNLPHLHIRYFTFVLKTGNNLKHISCVVTIFWC